MPLSLPTSCARISIEGGYGGVTFANVFHVGTTSIDPPDTSDLDDLANAVADAYHDNFMPLMWHTALLTQASIQFMTLSDILISSVVSRSDTGSMTGTAAPSSLAGVVSWSISEAYRGGHPRTYIGALEDGQVQDINHLTSTYVSGLDSAAGGFLSDVNGYTSSAWLDVGLGIVRTVRSRVILDPPEIALITGHRVSSRIRTQRRRLNPH